MKLTREQRMERVLTELQRRCALIHDNDVIITKSFKEGMLFAVSEMNKDE